MMNEEWMPLCWERSAAIQVKGNKTKFQVHIQVGGLVHWIVVILGTFLGIKQQLDTYEHFLVQINRAGIQSSSAPWNATHTCLQIPLGPSMLHFLCCWSCGSECHMLFQSHISSAQSRLPLGADWNKESREMNPIRSWQRCGLVSQGFLTSLSNITVL